MEAPTIKITCRFPITMQQAEIAAFCRQFGLTYVRHTSGGGPNDYWIVVQVESLPPEDQDAVISKALKDFIYDTMVIVAIRRK